MGFRHFLDVHEQPERTVLLRMPPPFSTHVPITLLQQPLCYNSGSEGDNTGQVLWKSAECLANLVLARGYVGALATAEGFTSNHESRRYAPLAVELGCGACALPTMAAALVGYRAVGTDIGVMVARAQENLARNQEALATARHCTRALTWQPAQILELMWGAESLSDEMKRLLGYYDSKSRGARKNPLFGGASLVLAADVLYALPGKPILHEALATTLDALLNHSDPEAVAIFTYERRSGNETRFFEDTLPRWGFRWQQIEPAACSGSHFVYAAEVRRRSLGE